MHLYFNLVGTALFMAVFYGLNSFLRFSFLEHTAGGAIVAVIHSAFNVASTLVLLPASKLIVKLAYLTIPKTEEEELEVQTKVLDERFLERPAFAVAQCKSAVCDVAQLVENAFGLCRVAQENYDEKKVQKIMDIEGEIDLKEDELSSYLTKLSVKPLSERDSKSVGLYGRCITDFERISDYLKGIAYTQKKLARAAESFSEKARTEAEVIFEATQEIVECTVQCFVHEDADLALRVDPLADVIGELKKTIRRNHNKRLARGECSVELGMALTDMVNSLERIAKHCSNIAEEEIAARVDQYALHQYVRSMKEGNEFYKELAASFRERFSVENLEKS